MLRTALLSFGVAGIALAQTPFANLYWEVNDGGGWTRTQLTTTQQNVQVRLLAEWGGMDAYAFGGTQFDAVIQSVDGNDNVSNMTRPPPFNFAPLTLAAFRFGNMIKLDNSNDFDAPGVGGLWVDCGQTGVFGDPLDPSNPAIIFRFDLQFTEVAGNRQINSVSRLLPGPPAYNSRLLNFTSGSIRVQAEIFAVDVMFVPAPASIALLGCSAVLVRRRR